MIEECWDINEEYKKIFGSREHINLFETEEEYNELRQFIQDQPKENFVSKILPFEGIDILVKDESKRKRDRIKNPISKDIINKAEKTNKIVQHPKEESIFAVSEKMHYFFIKEDGVCDAKGYYNEEKKYFFICKDSLVSYNTDIIYAACDTEKARHNFINKICEEIPGYYRVIRDAKCRSALAAASYVLGRLADSSCWKDSNGKSLSDVYPNIYFSSIKKQEQPSPKKEKPVNPIKKTMLGRLPRYYYIIRENMGDRSCNAKGTYDKVNDKFIILEGSVLAYEVTSSYRYTASDIKRNKFIQLNCKGKFENKLKRDAICNSPDEAACFVLGEKANGWTEWKSKEGISLDSYISKVLV